MWDIVISIVILNTLHSASAGTVNFRPVIFMNDLQKSNILRNAPEPRPMRYKIPKPVCGPAPYPNYNCEPRQPTCNTSQQGVLHTNQDPNCNPARPPSPYRVSSPYPKQYPQMPQRNPQRPREYPPPMLRERGWQYPKYGRPPPPPRYAPGRTTPRYPGYYNNRAIPMNYGSTLSTRHIGAANDSPTTTGKTGPTQSTTSTFLPSRTISRNSVKNIYGTTSTQAPFPGGMTPSMDTEAVNKCGQFAVCYHPVWTDTTKGAALRIRTKKHEEMDPDLMKYIWPRR